MFPPVSNIYAKLNELAAGCSLFLRRQISKWYRPSHLSSKCLTIPLVPVVYNVFRVCVLALRSDSGALWLLLFQVDSSETLSDSDAEGKALTEVHSIGVQVEDDKR